MAYTLSQFCADHHALLRSGQPLEQALPRIAEKLSALLRNPEFVAETFNEDTPFGRRTLHHDTDTDVYVLAHVYDGPKKGSPHNHGASWAVYGNAKEVTEMTEWRRVNPESEARAVLEPISHYALGPGQSRSYGPHVIHSTAHPKKAWVIRIIGTKLSEIPRYHFNPETDVMLEAAAAK